MRTLYSAHVHLHRCTCAVQAHTCIMRKKRCARLSCTCAAVSIERPALWDLRVVIGSSLDGAFKTNFEQQHTAHINSREIEVILTRPPGAEHSHACLSPAEANYCTGRPAIYEPKLINCGRPYTCANQFRNMAFLRRRIFPICA